MAVLQSERILLVQPHSDDACLAISPALITGVLDPRQTTIATLFSRSNFIPYDNQAAFEGLDVSEVRASEDRAFAKELGMTCLLLEEPDCLLREGKILAMPEIPLDDGYVSHLSKLIVNAVAKAQATKIVCSAPSGPKQHLDHRYAAKAVKNVGLIRELATYYHDDVPYSHLSSEALHNEMLTIAHVVRLDDNVSRRQAALAALYASQMGDHFYEPLREYQGKIQALARLFQ